MIKVPATAAGIPAIEELTSRGVNVNVTLPAADASSVLEQAEAAGVDLAALTAELEREGVEAFRASYRELLDCIDAKVRRSARSSRAPYRYEAMRPRSDPGSGQRAAVPRTAQLVGLGGDVVAAGLRAA